MIRRPPRSTLITSSAASDVYKRQDIYHYYLRFFEVETLDQTLFLIGVATDYAKEYPDAPYIWKQNKNNDLEIIGTSNIEKYSLNFELSK